MPLEHALPSKRRGQKSLKTREPFKARGHRTRFNRKPTYFRLTTVLQTINTRLDLRIRLLATMICTLGVAAMTTSSIAQEFDVWIGNGGANGIYHARLNAETGILSQPVSAGGVNGGGFLAMHPNGKTLYAASWEGDQQGVAAFSIAAQDQEKMLDKLRQEKDRLLEKLGKRHPRVREINRRIKDLGQSKTLKKLNFVSSGDGGCACVGLDDSGKVLMSAQYGGGSATTYLINEDGSIKERVSLIEHGAGSGVNPKRQKDSHPHWVGTSPDNRFMLVPDLGKDATVVYELDAKTAKIKKHSEAKSPPGAGPRHMKFHTSGKFAYVLNEMSLDISVFKFNAADAAFESIQLIKTLPENLKDKHLNSAAEIRVHPSGKFVYSSNRGHDSIAAFSVDQATGQLTFMEHAHVRGAWPRNFNIDPTGKWLLVAGRHSNTLTVFEIDSSTGQLTYHRQCVNVPAPICVLIEE